ncbi:MAG TPA: hypothetical protein VHF02_03510 [Luteimonas sp.]|nr:hypothetical protein [Luteimonas sp.]
MSSARAGTAGTTRVCPHCKTTILDSASVCPSCKHHLRFETIAQRALESSSALRVEGTIRHPSDGQPWEYSVVLTIRNDRGEEVARQVVGVGGLRANEQRTFTLDVEMFTPAGAKLTGAGSRH